MNQQTESYRQAHREALWAIALAFGYFIWWYATAYGFSPSPESQALPELYWGMPLWFLLSCVIGPVLFTLLCALMVKYVYRNFSLTTEEDGLESDSSTLNSSQTHTSQPNPDHE
ncbi:YhdT family protein [Vibrio rhizosphaerae]|uniref:YhdT family protein n=1 Tax=Vibrio rhizosphaerae TaxID=398736 RepID=UPI00068D2AE9|nr:YhdT family protein [Vibrio rhizosphaerae]